MSYYNWSEFTDDELRKAMRRYYKAVRHELDHLPDSEAALLDHKAKLESLTTTLDEIEDEFAARTPV